MKLGRDLSSCPFDRAYLDARPRLMMMRDVLVFLPGIVVLVLLGQIGVVLVMNQGLLLGAAFVAVRDVVSTATALFTFFWYVQMSAVAHLHGEGRRAEGGAYIAFGTLASLACSAVVMLALLAAAEPLLRFISPPGQRAQIVEIATAAQYIVILALPCAVFVSPATGVLLGLKYLVTTVAVFGLWALASVVVVLALVLPLDCDDQLAELRAASNFTSVDESQWVCPEAEGFLTASSVGALAVAAGLALHLLIVQTRVGRAEGMLRPGASYLGLLREVELASLRGLWSEQTTGVAVRSVLNNARWFVSLALALRCSLATGAALIVASSIGNVAYNVPNLVASVTMIDGSKLLGEGRYGVVLRTLQDFRVVALGFGAIFLGAALLVDPTDLSSTYSNQVEQAALADKLVPAWPLVVLAQPFRCLVAVYGPLLMCTQSYTYWGKAVAFLSLCVWLPLTLAAYATASFATFVLSFAAYDVLHVALLYYKVHLVEGARYARLAAAAATLKASADACAAAALETDGAPQVYDAAWDSVALPDDRGP